MRLSSDPWIAAQIDEVVALYAGRLPPKQIEWMREQLEIMLASDEAASALLRGALSRHVDESGEVARDSPDSASAQGVSPRIVAVKPPKAG